jgi:hypothetical protein
MAAFPLRGVLEMLPTNKGLDFRVAGGGALASPQ